MSVKPANQLASTVHRVQNAGLPALVQQFAMTGMFNYKVKFAGTAGIWIQGLTPSESVVYLANRRRVQNHIGGIHACGMALLAESATGVVFGMNLPDTHIPLIKSMKIDFKRRAQGSLTAVASLTPEQVELIQKEDRGEVNVNVQVSDDKGGTPIECEMIWAWVPKPSKKKESNTTTK